MSETVLPSSTPGDVVAEDAALPEALSVPTREKSLSWRLLLSLAHLVVFMSLIPTFQVLLPNELAALDPARKATLLALVSLAGAIPALLGNLLGGALSDRTTSRFGRRRPWVVGGGVVIAISLLILALAPGLPLIVVGVVLLQLSVNATQACLTAIVPDQVPLSQRATVSAFASFALPLGAVVGVAIIAQALHGARTAYYVLAGVLIVALALFVFLVPDPVLPKENVPAFDGKAFFSSFVRPLKSADFSLVLLGRVFVMFGYYIVVNYLLYYLEDAVGVKDPAVATSRVGMSQLLMTIILVASTIVTGIFSDRLQRRKPFVIGSAVIMAVSLLILALFPVLPMVFVAAAVLGLGFGGFLSGDLALQTQVLPARRDNGKDLGILNLGSLLPQILVPIVVGIALTFLHSYPIMFLIGAILAVLGGALIILVKSVR